VRRAPSGAASHTVYHIMALGSVRAALMGCAAVIVATGGMILDKDQYDKVSRTGDVCNPAPLPLTHMTLLL
jgi:hypothetical protein